MLRRSFGAGILVAALFSCSAYPQQDLNLPKRALITQPVNNQKRVTLSGQTLLLANAATDRGMVPDNLPMEHVLLQLQRPTELQQALDRYTGSLQNPSSPYFHKWLTAAQFGQHFGLAASDINTITAWLESEGFMVNRVYPNLVTIDFSGTAGQIRQAFETEIHHVMANAVLHVANMHNPQIPAALAPAVAGFSSMHNFTPHAMKKKKLHADYTVTLGGSPYQVVVPADLATIYNLNPLFKEGITGRGQTIAVIDDSDLYSAADWTTFRRTLGLSKFTAGSLTTVHPGGCAAPGLANGDDDESAIDVEWATAAAPGAAIQLATCDGTNATGGVLLALENLVNSNGNLPAVVSISYGICEVINGAPVNASYSQAFQQAVVEGISAFVSAGDEGAASCDADELFAYYGVGVSGYASTPYNVAVGGTDFGDAYAGTVGTYWSSTNTAAYGSALSYIPEIPWNDSCAGVLAAAYWGFNTSSGPSGFCNTGFGSEFLGVAAGSGGPSGCATGSAAKLGLVSGTCQGNPKPAWQAGVLGNPNDGVRDIPDVSLFAANGIWGHYYVICFSDSTNGGVPCTGDPVNWSGAGGTSFSSPIMAGIQALVNQFAGGRAGNPNPVYYALASAEYGTTGSSSCLSNNGNTVAGTCTFYDVTTGDNVVNCYGFSGCDGSFGSWGTFLNGTLALQSTSAVPFYGQGQPWNVPWQPAYSAGPGWDFATGLGSVNAYNLVHNWQTGVMAVSK